MLKLFLLFTILALVIGALSSVAMAATTATVTATVTVQNISVTVSTGTVAYGTLGSNATASSSAAQTLTNNGNVSETFTIKGQNSANWTLAATAGADQYVHKFCTAACAVLTTNYTALTTSNQTLATGIAASGTQKFDLYINTPTSSTNFTSQSVDVIVTATAT